MLAPIYLAAAALALLLALNVWRPLYTPASLAVVSFFAGWLTGELALHHVAWQLVATLFCVRAGLLATWPGQLGLGLAALSWVLLVAAYLRGHAQRALVLRALDDSLGIGWREEVAAEVAAPRPAVEWLRQLAVPIPVWHPGVECLGHIPFHDANGTTLKLDVHRLRSRPVGCPTLVYVHGGGWVIGHRQRQGLPLLQHLASRGWVAFSVDHRLSPRATFPEHIIDVKRALAWIRAHGAEYGADPSCIVIAGNSSGAHLASLAALTANDPEYQPGFERADTAVQGCLAFYGVYDLVGRHAHWPNDGMRWLLERYILKRSRAADPLAYASASPFDRIHADRPPFWQVHGSCDSLSPVAEGRRFAEALRAAPGAPSCYLELPGAQHAFEIFPSPRALHVIDGAAAFASWIHARHQARVRVAA